MKERILTGWTFTRMIYIVLGIAFMIQSIMQSQWPGAILGFYFASMGLFAFGCASGNCKSGSRQKSAWPEEKEEIGNIIFEEEKQK